MTLPPPRTKRCQCPLARLTTYAYNVYLPTLQWSRNLRPPTPRAPLHTSQTLQIGHPKVSTRLRDLIDAYYIHTYPLFVLHWRQAAFGLLFGRTVKNNILLKFHA